MKKVPACTHPKRLATHKFCSDCGAVLSHPPLATSPPTTGNVRSYPKNFSEASSRFPRPSPTPPAPTPALSYPAPALPKPSTAARPIPSPPAPYYSSSSSASSSMPRRPSRSPVPSPTSAAVAGYAPQPAKLSAAHSSLPAAAPQAGYALPQRATPGAYGSASAPVSMHCTGSPNGASSGSVGASSPSNVSGPTRSARPEERDMTKEERELHKLLREVEREKEKVLKEERLKAREKTMEKEEGAYTLERQREFIQKANAGQLDLLKRESVYVHQIKNEPVLTLELLNEVATEKHNGKQYTTYKIRVSWADCVWTIQRRYSQFRDFHNSVKWKTNIKLPYPLPSKKLIGSSLEDDVIEQRKVGLRQYLLGVQELQLEFVNNEKYEQVFIRFVGPFQLGDTKDRVPTKLPFKVVL